MKIVKISSKVSREIFFQVTNVYPTGIEELDNLLDGGFKPFNKYLIYGESGTGKSYIVRKMLYNNINELEGAIYINYKKEPVKPTNKLLHANVDSIDTVARLLDELFQIKKKINVLVIDDLNHLISRYDRNTLDKLTTVLQLINQFIIRDYSLAIIITGVSQIPGETGYLKPKIPRQLIPYFNKVILTIKVDKLQVRYKSLDGGTSLFTLDNR